MSRQKKEYDENGYEIRTGKEKPDTAGKTENFFTRNVRLITFLVCVGVFVALFGPIAMMEADNYLENENDSKYTMTLENVLTLAKQNGYISASQIKDYANRQNETEDEIYYYIDIEPNYFLFAVADKNSQMLLYCDLSNLDTGKSVDVLKGDVKAFLEEN